MCDWFGGRSEAADSQWQPLLSSLTNLHHHHNSCQHQYHDLVLITSIYPSLQFFCTAEICLTLFTVNFDVEKH